MKRFNYKDLPIISKLIIGLTFSLFLATATGYFILGNVARNSLIETISESTLLFSQELTNEIDRSIDNRIDFWRIHAAEPQFIENIKTSNNQLEKITNLEQLIEERDSQWIKTEIPRAEWMLELYNNEDSVELRKTIKLFEQQNGHLVFSEVFVTNQKGMVTALSDWTTDYNQADEVWWQKAMEDGLYIGETTFDESSQVRALEIGIRVEDENNRPIGVMKVLLNVEDLFKIITDIITENQSAQFISAKIFDENNELIYSTSNDYDPKVINEVTNYFRYEPHNIHYLLVEKKNNGKDFFIHQNLDQKELASKLNWLLILEQESKEMFAPINKQNKLFIFIILITAIILFSYNIFISRLIISPITNLLNTIIEVKNGNRNKKAKVEGNDEVGILAKNFNEMSDKLNKLDKLKTEFLSIAAHQLRTPMGIIRWDLELIRDGGLGKISKPIKKKIVEIHETTLRVINLVNDLLNLTHIEQGKFGNNPTLVNIRKIIDSSVKSENNI